MARSMQELKAAISKLNGGRPAPRVSIVDRVEQPVAPAPQENHRLHAVKMALAKVTAPRPYVASAVVVRAPSTPVTARSLLVKIAKMQGRELPPVAAAQTEEPKLPEAVSATPASQPARSWLDAIDESPAPRGSWKGIPGSPAPWGAWRDLPGSPAPRGSWRDLPGSPAPRLSWRDMPDSSRLEETSWDMLPGSPMPLRKRTVAAREKIPKDLDLDAELRSLGGAIWGLGAAQDCAGIERRLPQPEELDQPMWHGLDDAGCRRLLQRLREMRERLNPDRRYDGIRRDLRAKVWRLNFYIECQEKDRKWREWLAANPDVSDIH